VAQQASAGGDEKYRAPIRQRLNGLFTDRALHEEYYDPTRDRIVIFSDHHRGKGDGADDFARCEYAYRAALGYYFDQGYRLFLLGDVEELWEESKAENVFGHYESVYKLERDFAKQGRLERFWGNHDLQWANLKQFRRRLAPQAGVSHIREAMRLKVRRDGGDEATIFLTHGHQGTPDSEKWAWAAKIPVRFVWPVVQRLQGMSATRPAVDAMVRGRHDRALFAWACEQRNRILIAGHTHKPVFGNASPTPPTRPPVAELEEQRQAAREAGDRDAASVAAAELEYTRATIERPDDAVEATPPTYFNTGCCAFPDGDITGIELADGQIRLVRFPAQFDALDADDGSFDPEQRILEQADLYEVLDAVAAPADPPQLIIRPVMPVEP